MERDIVHSHGTTSFFHVHDPEAFRADVLRWNGLMLDSLVIGGERAFSISAEPGWVDYRIVPEIGLVEPFDIFRLIQPHLRQGELVLLSEVLHFDYGLGYEVNYWLMDHCGIQMTGTWESIHETLERAGDLHRLLPFTKQSEMTHAADY